MIYIARSGVDGPIKIGFTIGSPFVRLGSLQTGSPTELSLVGCIWGSLSQEKEIHLVLSRFKASGEWYHPHPIVLAAVETLLTCGKQVVFANKGRPENAADRIIDALGGNQAVAKITSSKASAVSNWRKSNSFPSRQFVPMKNALARIGMEAPSSLWKMLERPTRVSA